MQVSLLFMLWERAHGLLLARLLGRVCIWRADRLDNSFGLAYFQRMSTKTPLDDLTEKQRAFVREFAKLGGKRGTRIDACRLAGYEGENLDVVAWDLLRKPKIIAAVEYQIRINVLEHAPMAVQGIIDIAQDDRINFRGDPITPSATRLSAYKELKDMAGLGVVSKSEQNIRVETDTVTIAQARADIAAMFDIMTPAEQLQAQKYLAPPVEAEFEEVVNMDWLDALAE